MKTLTASEKVEKSVRESDFTFREINQKKAKKAFMGTFDFQGKKKGCIFT